MTCCLFKRQIVRFAPSLPLIEPTLSRAFVDRIWVMGGPLMAFDWTGCLALSKVESQFLWWTGSAKATMECPHRADMGCLAQPGPRREMQDTCLFLHVEMEDGNAKRLVRRLDGQGEDLQGDFDDTASWESWRSGFESGAGGVFACLLTLPETSRNCELRASAMKTTRLVSYYGPLRVRNYGLTMAYLLRLSRNYVTGIVAFSRPKSCWQSIERLQQFFGSCHARVSFPWATWISRRAWEAVGKVKPGGHWDSRGLDAIKDLQMRTKLPGLLSNITPLTKN